MSHAPMESLPPKVRALIDDWIADAGLTGAVAREVRADLQQHFRDGLDAGRSPEELVRAFGDPGVSAPMLADAARRHRSAHRRAAVGPSTASLDPPPTAPARRRPSARAVFADLRYALRALRRSPIQTVVVVAVLALGIGATAIAITIVNEVFLEPLPIADQESMVHVLADVPGGNSFTGFSFSDFERLRADNDVLVGLAAMSAVRVPFGPEPTDERVVATLVSPGYFELLGVSAAVGTVSLPPFTGWGADAQVVVSHRFWSSRLGGDPGTIGSEIRLNGRPFMVIGVAASDFTGTFIGFPSDVWVPLSSIGDFRAGIDPDDPAEKFLELFGRRRPGVGVADVDAGLDAVAAEIERVYPDANRDHRVRIVPLTGIDDSLRAGVYGFVTVLGALSVLVLVVACLNAGGILLVRTMARERELAIRLAIGAGGARLVGQLLLETALVAAGGAGAAIAVSAFASTLLSDFVATVSGGLGLDLDLDWRVVSLTTTVACVAAVAIAAAPGAYLLRKSPATVLRRGVASRGSSWPRKLLVIAQVGASLTLVVSAGLFARALSRGLAVDPGFDADRVASVALPSELELVRQLEPGLQPEMGVEPEPVREVGAVDAERRGLVADIRRLPGVTTAALAANQPVGVGRSPVLVSVPGVEPPPGAPGFVVDVRRIGAGYLEAVGVELLAGRALTPEDMGPGSPTTALVSEAFADRFFTGVDPIGRSIEVEGRTLRVVGVARDVRYVLQDDTPDPLVYEPLPSPYAGAGQVVLRSSGPPGDLAPAIRSLLSGTDPSRRPAELRPVRDVLSGALLPQRVGVVLVGTMGIIALFLATVGLYGLMQHMVRSDMRATGIRMALGADRTSAVLAVLRGGAMLVALGVVVGAAAALAVTPLLRPFLFDLAPHDPVTYVTAIALFLAVGVGASLMPALRAAAIDPARTLRTD